VVTHTLDVFVESDLKIVSQIVLRIQQCLMCVCGELLIEAESNPPNTSNKYQPSLLSSPSSESEQPIPRLTSKSIYVARPASTDGKQASILFLTFGPNFTPGRDNCYVKFTCWLRITAGASQTF